MSADATVPTLGFVFPGQGSQSVGMLAGLAAASTLVRETFDQASEALHLDLWRLVQDGPEARLNQTEHTQPAMLAAGVALWRVWEAEGGPRPALMAGHSLGEYTALVCAGSLDFADAIPLVAERGRLMQAAVAEGEGAMAAVLGLDDETVRAVCAEASAGGVVAAANYNAPGQVVVAGEAAAVTRALGLARERGAKRAVTLPVSVPSHCPLMAPAAERLAGRLAGVSLAPPAIPVVHNASVTVESDPQAIRDALVSQLHSPVRWVETIAAMQERGITTVVECGPGKVLAGLNKRIARAMGALAVHDTDSLNAALAAVRGEA